MKQILSHSIILFTLAFTACQKNSELKPGLDEDPSLNAAKEFLKTQLSDLEYRQLDWSNVITYKKNGVNRVLAVPNRNSLEKKSAYVFFDDNKISGNWVSFETDNNFSLKYKKIISESFNGIRVGVVDINERGNVQAINIYENGLLSNQISFRTSALMYVPATISGPDLSLLLLAQLLGIGQPGWYVGISNPDNYNNLEYLEPDGQGNTGGSGGSGQIYDWEIDDSNSKIPINIEDYLRCFSQLPSNGASYSIKIYVDVPVDEWPSSPINLTDLSPGHVSLRLSKYHSTGSAHQVIGFYPQSGPKSLAMIPVASKVVDDGLVGQEHEYNASLVMSNITEQQFNTILDKLREGSQYNYELDGFNCVYFILNAVNTIRTNPLTSDPMLAYIPGITVPIIIPFSPQGLYSKLQTMVNVSHPEAANIEMAVVNKTVTSKGPCQ